MLTIGINEGINSAVLVSENGKITFALQEERLNKQKEFIGFPTAALEFALAHHGITAKDVGAVCLSNNHLNLPASREAFLAGYEKRADEPVTMLRDLCVRTISSVMPEAGVAWLQRIRGKAAVTADDAIRRVGFSAPIHRSDHHFNHAAAAYYGRRQDPETPHLVLTADGGGDNLCASVHLARDGKLELLATTHEGHSIGNIYASVTHFMGMKPHEHEYKLMGLAAYAEPAHAGRIKDYFHGLLGLDPADPLRFRRRIAEPTYLVGRRLQRELRRVRFDNLAGGLQGFVEDILLEWVRAAVARTGVRKLVAAGGVFMNVKANKTIAEKAELEYFDVFPSCGDETLPFGAVWSRYAQGSPDRGRDIRLDDFWLGPEGGHDVAEAKRRYAGRVKWQKLDQPNQAAAELLAAGVVVARCSGKLEFGARALGNRSILADPADQRVVPLINKMIKQRDFWMPFAPAILAEHAADYLVVPSCLPKRDISPFMMHTFDTTGRRPEFYAGTHAYDGTARAQIVSRATNPSFHDLISRYQALTGKGVVLNTSFNLHGYPLVLGACDAVSVFLDSGLTHLVIEDELVTKA